MTEKEVQNLSEAPKNESGEILVPRFSPKLLADIRAFRADPKLRPTKELNEFFHSRGAEKPSKTAAAWRRAARVVESQIDSFVAGFKNAPEQIDEEFALIIPESFQSPFGEDDPYSIEEAAKRFRNYLWEAQPESDEGEETFNRGLNDRFNVLTGSKLRAIGMSYIDRSNMHFGLPSLRAQWGKTPQELAAEGIGNLKDAQKSGQYLKDAISTANTAYEDVVTEAKRAQEYRDFVKDLYNTGKEYGDDVVATADFSKVTETVNNTKKLAFGENDPLAKSAKNLDSATRQIAEEFCEQWSSGSGNFFPAKAIEDLPEEPSEELPLEVAEDVNEGFGNGIVDRQEEAVDEIDLVAVKEKLAKLREEIEEGEAQEREKIDREIKKEWNGLWKYGAGAVTLGLVFLAGMGACEAADKDRESFDSSKFVTVEQYQNDLNTEKVKLGDWINAVCPDPYLEADVAELCRAEGFTVQEGTPPAGDINLDDYVTKDQYAQDLNAEKTKRGDLLNAVCTDPNLQTDVAEICRAEGFTVREGTPTEPTEPTIPSETAPQVEIKSLGEILPSQLTIQLDASSRPEGFDTVNWQVVDTVKDISGVDLRAVDPSGALDWRVTDGLAKATGYGSGADLNVVPDRASFTFNVDDAVRSTVSGINVEVVSSNMPSSSSSDATSAHIESTAATIYGDAGDKNAQIEEVISEFPDISEKVVVSELESADTASQGEIDVQAQQEDHTVAKEDASPTAIENPVAPPAESPHASQTESPVAQQTSTSRETATVTHKPTLKPMTIAPTGGISVKSDNLWPIVGLGGLAAGTPMAIWFTRKLRKYYGLDEDEDEDEDEKYGILEELSGQKSKKDKKDRWT